MELRAYYHIPQLYMTKFIKGFEGFHKYSSYTQNSLEKVIESANRCINLQQKSHFNLKRYKYSKESCQIVKDAAIAFQPLEEKRLVLLATESCKRDLPNCKEYNELHQEMRNIMRKRSSKWINLSRSYDIALFY